MSESQCLIWGTRALQSPRLGDWRELDSARVGGKYRVVGSLEPRLAELPIERKLSLSRWIAEQHRFGVTSPELHSYNFDQVGSLPCLPFSARVRAVILTLGRTHKRMDDALTATDRYPASHAAGNLMSLAEIEDGAELFSFLGTLVDMGLLVDLTEVVGRREVKLSPSGWERFEKLTLGAPDSSQAFVAMWFNDATKTVYDEGIEPAIRESGYKALRIDNKEHVGKIDDEIISEIRRSRFVVADFTCESEKVRGGVYYEAGFARGLNIQVIWTVKDTSLKDVHFDIRQHSHIVWTDPTELKARLKVRIAAVIGDGPLPRS